MLHLALVIAAKAPLLAKDARNGAPLGRVGSWRQETDSSLRSEWTEKSRFLTGSADRFGMT
jgi:hypothetical protein